MSFTLSQLREYNILENYRFIAKNEIANQPKEIFHGKKLIRIAVVAIMMIGVFGLTACESINRVTVEYDGIAELQASLPDLYYFDFEAEGLESTQCTSYAILTQNLSGKKHEYFGYRITCNIRLNTEVVVLSIVDYKYSSRDFVLNDLRISSEYQNATQRDDYIEERMIDEFRCVIYVKTTLFFGQMNNTIQL